MLGQDKKSVGNFVAVTGRNRRLRLLEKAGVGSLAFVGLSLLVAMNLGGCPTFAPPVLPVNPGSGSGSLVPGVATDIPAVIQFTYPVDSDEQVTHGDLASVTVYIRSVITTAFYVIQLDPDTVANNGNEIEIASGGVAGINGVATEIEFSTALVPNGAYYIRGIVADGSNPLVTALATKKLYVLAPGLLAANRPASVWVSEPADIVALIQNGQFTVRWCARDPDDAARVLIVLDSDNDGNNDVSFSNLTEVNSICNGTLPRTIGNVIVLACRDEQDCPPGATTQPAQANSLTWTVDATVIPPRPDGQPYRVRVDVTDERNRVSHAYAPGGVIVLPTVTTSLVDLGNIGRTLGGAVFQGFDAGGRLGQAFSKVPDLNEDGADECVMVAQFGHPFEQGPVGSAYMPFGRVASRFGGLIPVNSIGVSMTGIVFSAGPNKATEGLQTVTYIPSLDTDDKVELLFGLPYVEGLPDYEIVNPCKAGGGCYVGIRGARRSAPESFDPAPDDALMGVADSIETTTCSNDGDIAISTPIISGYMIYVPSVNLVNTANSPPTPFTQMVDLHEVGSGWTNEDYPTGARFRGAWYDFDISQVDWPYAIVPTTRFGLNIAAMPPLSNGADLGGFIREVPVPWGQSYVNSTPRQWSQAGRSLRGPHLRSAGGA